MPESLDGLLGRLSREAEAQTASLREAAEAEARAIVRDAETAAEAARAARLEAGTRRLRAETAGQVERARREGTRDLLSTRYGAIERILERAEALLPAMAGDARGLAAFDQELDAALRIVEGRAGVLTAAPVLAERAGARAAPGIAVRGDPAVAGFTLCTTDGRIEVDGTLIERFRRLRPLLAIRAAEALEVEP